MSSNSDCAAPSAQALTAGDGCLIGRFQALGCPCEILADTEDVSAGRDLLALARAEALRVEEKFSRYRAGSVLAAVNAGAGAELVVDDETANVLDYAARCFEISGGLFDATTGILRKAWKFDGGERRVRREDVEGLLAFVGWSKLSWSRPRLLLPAGMELDFGGIGKEYAADRIAALLSRARPVAVLVNLGGDIATAGARRGGRAWSVGIEDAARPGTLDKLVSLKSGALATSGDAHRFATVEGRRLGHILDPRTGWPVEDAPRSATVAAATCTEAGFLAKLALMHGRGAEAFLTKEGVKHWIVR